jgi:thioredoxin reductase
VTEPEQFEVLVIGAGPAGLAAAHALVTNGVRRVTVIDREQQAGGVPRHCHHSGFGIRDLRRTMSGPRYAVALVRRALAAGVRIETETMATGWSTPGVLSLTSPGGARLVSASAIVLATGARERPRSARLVPGDRPDGVFTTGQLQQWVQLRDLPVGRRAIVVGAEHVSYSAVLTLRSAGVQTVAMVTDLPRHQTYAGFAAAMRWGLRVPLWTDTEVADLRGHGRVSEVDLFDRAADHHRRVAVDTVVFTGDWIPDHELARSGRVALDPRSKGPVVDAAGRTSVDGILAAGNLVHPAETADIAALRGAAVGTSLAGRLTNREIRPAQSTVDIVVAAPLSWSSPGRIAVGTDHMNPPAGLILHTTEFRRRPTVVIAQGDRPLARFKVREAIPNRSLRVPLDWSTLVQADAGPVHIHLT